MHRWHYARMGKPLSVLPKNSGSGLVYEIYRLNIFI
jgi:hypothetical protein